MALLPSLPMRSAISSFYESVYAHFAGEKQLGQALITLERAVSYLSAVKVWWHEQGKFSVQEL
jgi:hypothetical protein